MNSRSSQCYVQAPVIYCHMPDTRAPVLYRYLPDQKAYTGQNFFSICFWCFTYLLFHYRIIAQKTSYLCICLLKPFYFKNFLIFTGHNDLLDSFHFFYIIICSLLLVKKIAPRHQSSSSRWNQGTKSSNKKQVIIGQKPRVSCQEKPKKKKRRKDIVNITIMVDEKLTCILLEHLWDKKYVALQICKVFL